MLAITLKRISCSFRVHAYQHVSRWKRGKYKVRSYFAIFLLQNLTMDSHSQVCCLKRKECLQIAWILNVVCDRDLRSINRSFVSERFENLPIDTQAHKENNIKIGSDVTKTMLKLIPELIVKSITLFK